MTFLGPKPLCVWNKCEPTFGTAAWKRMLVTGVGAEDSMEMITTSTSARDGGESRAKVNRTRRLCLSNTLTGNRLPGFRGEGKMDYQESL